MALDLERADRGRLMPFWEVLTEACVEASKPGPLRLDVSEVVATLAFAAGRLAGLLRAKGLYEEYELRELVLKNYEHGAAAYQKEVRDDG